MMQGFLLQKKVPLMKQKFYIILTAILGGMSCAFRLSFAILKPV